MPQTNCGKQVQTAEYRLGCLNLRARISEFVGNWFRNKHLRQLLPRGSK
jgi:hypothetical protein